MKVYVTTIILLSFLTSQMTYSKDSNQKKEQGSIQTTMHQIGSTMKELYPYLFSDENFKAKKNKPFIKNNLKKLQQLFAAAKNHLDLKTVSYKVSYQVINDHLDSSYKVFNRGNKNYAQTMIKEATGLCISCHSQDHIKKGLFLGVDRFNFKSDFEYAQFSHMTRNYSKAIKYFDHYLENLKGKSSANIRSAIYRLVMIYTQNENSPHKGIQKLKQISRKKDLPKIIKVDIQDWILGFQNWEKSPLLQKAPLHWAEMEKITSKYLTPMAEGGAFNISGKEEIIYLKVASLLTHFLSQHPVQQDIPKILYWLAVTDRVLNYQYFYSLGDLYLKECITGYAKHPFAEKCYQEYKEFLIFSFNSSKIEDLPSDIKLELNTLKQKLEGTLQ